jgi:hypothetical protein
VDSSIPGLIATAERGDRSSAETLVATLHAELHGVARREFTRRGFVTPAMRGISERTVQRQWEKARIYLHHALRRYEPRRGQ